MCGGPVEKPKELVHGTGWREESKRRLDVKGGCCSDWKKKRDRKETKEQTNGLMWKVRKAQLGRGGPS